MPGIPLFVLTHRAPDTVPAGDPPYTLVTDGIQRAVEQAQAAAAGQDVALLGASLVQQCLRGRPAGRAHHQPGAGGAGSRRPPAGGSGTRERPIRPGPRRGSPIQACSSPQLSRVSWLVCVSMPPELANLF